MKKRKRYLHYSATLLIVGFLSILAGSNGFVGADEQFSNIANLATSLLVFGGVTIGLSALLFMGAMSAEK